MTDLQTLAAMTTTPRYIDHVRWAHPWAALWSESQLELVHIADESPLPPLVPLTGRAPREALIRAVVEADFDALREELSDDPSGINDPIPHTEGKTLLHFAARLYGQADNNFHRAGQVRRLALEHITRVLLEAGADPLAKDDCQLFPATYAHGYSPASLRDRMMRIALEDRFTAFNGIGLARYNHPKKRSE